MADMIEVMRNEKKYIISTESFRTLNSYFSKLLHPDKHNQAEGYIVRSLYFDTYSNTDYFEKLDGLERRKKIRLRIYDTGTNTAKLEVKHKSGQYQLKQSLTLKRDDALKLMEGFYSVLLNYDHDFAKKLFIMMSNEGYRPKSIIEYKRIAFVLPENNIRLNFDYNILATESNYELYSPSLNLYPIFHLDNMIFEVKYNRFLLSYLKDVISKCNKTETSFSKYCLSRNNSLF